MGNAWDVTGANTRALSWVLAPVRSHTFQIICEPDGYTVVLSQLKVGGVLDSCGTIIVPRYRHKVDKCAFLYLGATAEVACSDAQKAASPSQKAASPHARVLEQHRATINSAVGALFIKASCQKLPRSREGNLESC